MKDAISTNYIGIMCLSVLGVSAVLLQYSVVGDDIPVSPTPEKLQSRIAQLRDALSEPNRQASVKIDHQVSVQALIEIVKEELQTEGNRKLAIAAYSELGNHGDVRRGIEFLVQSIEFSGAPIEFESLRHYPAALALIKIGPSARAELLAVGQSLSKTNLQLRACVLARIEEFPVGDFESGRSTAVSRLLRHQDTIYGTIVSDREEKAKQLAINNIRYMINLLSDPTFRALPIPLDPANP